MKYVGPAYRAQTGYKPGSNQKAIDVINYEEEELGNKYDIPNNIRMALTAIPARDVMWVARTEKGAREYGEEIEDVTPAVRGGEILIEMPDGVLVWMI